MVDALALIAGVPTWQIAGAVGIILVFTFLLWMRIPKVCRQCVNLLTAARCAAFRLR